MRSFDLNIGGIKDVANEKRDEMEFNEGLVEAAI